MKTSRVKRRKGKHDKSVKHNKKQFKGAGNCSYNNSKTCRNEPLQPVQTVEPVQPLQPQLEISQPITPQNNISYFNELIDFLKKYNSTDTYKRDQKDLYENKILSILNDEEFDLSEINEEDQFKLLFNVLKSYNNNILKAYIKLPNPNITEKTMMDIMEQSVDNPVNSLNVHSYQFTYAIDMMKNNKQNFPNIKNFLEDRLNIVDTFTSEDIPKLIELLNMYIKLSTDINPNVRRLNMIKEVYYKNTIESILNNPQFDLSKINEEDRNKLLFNVMKSYNNNIITAYTTIPNPYITEQMLIDFMEKINNRSLLRDYEFTYVIDKMKNNKQNFPNIKNFLEDKLNIADTFTTADTPKIIELLNIYNKLETNVYNVDLRRVNVFKKKYYSNTIASILENKQLDLSKINEKDKLILLIYIIQTDNNTITDNYLKLTNTGLTEKMIKTAAESISSNFLFNKIKPKLENKLMKIKNHEEPIMQAMSFKRWNPSGEEMPKELQFNMLTYLQPKAKPTPSGITHDDFMRNAIQNAIDNPKVKSSSSRSNALGGRRSKKLRSRKLRTKKLTTKKLKSSNRRNTVRRNTVRRK